MAINSVNRVQLAPTDYSFMMNFIRIEPKWLNLCGIELECHIKYQMEYYKSIKSSLAKVGGCVPSDDKFIAQIKQAWNMG